MHAIISLPVCLFHLRPPGGRGHGGRGPLPPTAQQEALAWEVLPDSVFNS